MFDREKENDDNHFWELNILCIPPYNSKENTQS